MDKTYLSKKIYSDKDSSEYNNSQLSGVKQSTLDNTLFDLNSSNSRLGLMHSFLDDIFMKLNSYSGHDKLVMAKADDFKSLPKESNGYLKDIQHAAAIQFDLINELESKIEQIKTSLFNS